MIVTTYAMKMLFSCHFEATLAASDGAMECSMR